MKAKADNAEDQYSVGGTTGKTVFLCDAVSDIVFEGKIFVLTGHSVENEARITKIVEKRGGVVKSSCVLKTDYLVVNEHYEKKATTKYLKALELRERGKNIIIISAEQFFKLC